MFVATAAVGIGLAAIAGRMTASLVLPFATALVGAAFVFLTAPDPRFGFGFLHALGIIPLAFGAARIGGLQRPWARALVVIAIVILGARWAKVASNAGRERNWLTFPELPVVPTEERLTTSGLRVRVPMRGDLCWAAPLPCTPYFDASLRETGEMFRVAR